MVVAAPPVPPLPQEGAVVATVEAKLKNQWASVETCPWSAAVLTGAFSVAAVVPPWPCRYICAMRTTRVCCVLSPPAGAHEIMLGWAADTRHEAQTQPP